MIDLHCHILPNLDDGPTSLAMALEMARVALADGITTIAATPHGRTSRSVSWVYSVDLVQQRLTMLCAALAEADLPLTIVPGTEIFYESDVPERIKVGELLPYGNSRTILLEFGNDILVTMLEQAVFAVQLAGYRVLIAHPERIKVVQDNPNVLIPLIERGALLQLTADALTGSQGKRIQRLAETMVSHALVQVVASDAHGPHVHRMPLLAEAQRLAANLIGDAAATALVHDTPAAILADHPIDCRLPKPVHSRWKFW